MGSWANKTVFITGGSRGIGREIILRLAREGANITIAAKSDMPNPKLPGTIHSVAQEVFEAGGKALPVATDVRDEEQIKRAIEVTIQQFGSIDLLVNNAGFLGITQLGITETKKIRPDARLEHPRAHDHHARMFATLAGQQRQCIEPVPPTEPGRGLVGCIHPIHHHQVRHDAVEYGVSARSKSQGHRRKNTVASHLDCHCCGGHVQRRRRVEPVAQTRNHGRCGL